MRYLQILFLIALFPSVVPAATLNVPSQHSTIQAALNAANPGDIILVADGVYNESLTIKDGNISLRSVNPRGAILDGQNSLSVGITATASADFDDVLIEDFEIRNYTQIGIDAFSAAPRNLDRWEIRDMYVHHVGLHGIRVAGTDHNIHDNEIGFVTTEAEAIGILGDRFNDGVIQNNIVYMTRKNGIRLLLSNDSVVRDNLVAFAGPGLANNTGSGNTYSNNYSYDTAKGIITKHDDCASTNTRVIHNTTVLSINASLTISEGGASSDCAEAFNNIFATAGTAFINDNEGNRGTNYDINFNFFDNSNPDVFYDGNAEYSTFAAYKSGTGFGANSAAGSDPLFIDVKAGPNLQPGSPVFSFSGKNVTGTASYGTQVGARSTKTIPFDFSRLPITAVSASSDFGDADNLYDLNWDTQWSGGSSSENIVFSVGGNQRFNILRYTPLFQGSTQNIQSYAIDVGSSSTGPWSQISSGTVNDDGNPTIIEFAVQTTSFFRFRILNNHGAGSTTMRELWVGEFKPLIPVNVFYINGAVGVNDSGCGQSSGDPCATFAFGNSEHSFSAGDTVCIQNTTGTQELNEKIELTSAHSGTSGNPLIIDGKCDSQTDRGIIDGSGLDNSGVNALIALNGVDWVELHDLEIRDLAGAGAKGIRGYNGPNNIKIYRPKVHNIGAGGSASSIGISFGDGFGDGDGGHTHLIEGTAPSDRFDPTTYDCQMHGNFWNGFKIADNNTGGQSSTFRNCAVWDTQGNLSNSDSIQGSANAHNWTFEDFFVSNGPNGEDAMDLGWGSNSTDCLAQGGGQTGHIIQRGVFADYAPQGGNGAPGRSMLVLNGCTEDITIRNNIFKTAARGFHTYAHPKNIKVYHNTIYTGLFSVRLWQMIDGFEFINNAIISCVGVACEGLRPVHIDANTRQCCQNNNHCLWQSNLIVADGAKTDTLTMDIVGGSFTSGGCLGSAATPNETGYTESQLSTFEGAGWLGATSRTNDASWGTAPLFVDVGNNDFRLQSGDTVAKNQGQVVASVTTDFDGNPRDGTPDIGAFEEQSGPVADTGRFPEPIHNLTTDPGAIVIAASGCESTLESAAPGSTYLINAGTCTATVFNLDNITIYPNDGASVIFDGSGAATLQLGDNVTIAGITIDASDSTRCIEVDSSDNVILRSNNILGGRGGDCLRVENDSDTVLITRNNLNGGAGNDSSSGHNFNCTRSTVGTGPTNVTLSENRIYKDEAEIGGGFNWGSGTEDLISQRGCGANFLITKNWLDQMPSNGEEIVDLKENKDGAFTTFSYNFLDCRTLESAKKAMILQVESDHVGDATKNQINIRGNVFFACDEGPATGGLNYAASDSKPNTIEGDLDFNLFVMEADTDEALIVQELSNQANIRHNTIINGDIRFETGAGIEPENDFNEFTDNYLESIDTIDNTQFNATTCDDNGLAASLGTLDGSCTNTENTLAGLGDCTTSNTNLDCTPTSTAFLAILGPDGFIKGALVPPTLITAGADEPEIGALSNATLVIHLKLYNSGLPHDPAPIRNLDTSALTVTYDDVPQTINSTQVIGDNEVRLLMAASANSATVVKITGSTGYCTDSSDLGFATDIIGHAIDAKCAAFTERIIVNNLAPASASGIFTFGVLGGGVIK